MNSILSVIWALEYAFIAVGIAGLIRELIRHDALDFLAGIWLPTSFLVLAFNMILMLFLE